MLRPGLHRASSARVKTRYAVKEVFLTLQGEGAHAGRPAILLRFAGCNLWTGREADRASAACTFCDTDFAGTDGPHGGGYETADGLARQVAALWDGRDAGDRRPLVVCTGGEPLLQLDEPLIAALHAGGFEVAVETNGTVPTPRCLDWICVSPKAGTDIVVHEGHELKLVWPQSGLDPAAFETWDFERFSLQPRDGPELARNTRLALDYCLAHPRWHLSLQLHKVLGIP